MRKEFNYIARGLTFILLVAVSLFFLVFRYMDSETQKRVHEIAQVHLHGMAVQEVNRYKAIKSLRFRQMATMIEALHEKGLISKAEDVRRELASIARLQRLESCALIGEDGELETVYGEPVAKLGDAGFLMDSLRAGSRAVSSGWASTGQLVIYASPLSVPMAKGKRSLGLLWCKSIALFSRLINLDDPESLVYFHLLRRDGTYVVQSRGVEKENYFEKMLAYGKLNGGGSMQDEVERFKKRIAASAAYTLNVTYVNKERGVTERRSMRAVPLSESSWYLVSIIPYGVLDRTIEELNDALSRASVGSMTLLACAILAVCWLFAGMTMRQMDQLAKARTAAESALAESMEAQAKAEVARADALQHQQEAENAREEAVRANKTKSEFLSNMSHDIRTPMNSIIGLTTIARDHVGETARVEDCLKKILISGKQLLGLINDVLDMSKIESGKMTLKPEDLSLRETMETMCDIIRPQIKAKEQNFDVFISGIVAERVYCDGVRLNQVLLNFLSNAVKFTPEGGSIEIDLRQEPSPRGEDWVRTHFTVRDTGMGMTEAFRKKLFTAFEREDSRRVHGIQGTGLGLAIVKYIVTAMGGTIDVDTAPGKGTSFHVTVDLERVPVPQDGMVLPPWRVLVVDDSARLCQSAELALQELGVQTRSCLGGAQAVELVAQARERGEGFDFVLVDCKMPGMSGVETAVQIRELTGGGMPVCLISAYDWGDVEAEAKAAGIEGFIPKPLFKSTLFRVLSRYGEEGKTAAPETKENEQRMRLSGLRVLLAEDQPLNADIATTILVEAGASVQHAEDGLLAAKMFGESPLGFFDVILMDLRMPNMDGLEASRAIRAMSRADALTVPIIALTADAFAEDAQRCLDAGMNAHMSKPIDAVLLTRTLVRLRGKGAEAAAQ
ncbi:MAG: response regulator [Desulfovibrio sp.]|nr:response regulator [Desulfovibrio sp.]